MKEEDKERKDGPYSVQVESNTDVVCWCASVMVSVLKWRESDFSVLSVCML